MGLLISLHPSSCSSFSVVKINNANSQLNHSLGISFHEWTREKTRNTLTATYWNERNEWKQIRWIHLFSIIWCCANFLWVWLIMLKCYILTDSWNSRWNCTLRCHSLSKLFTHNAETWAKAEDMKNAQELKIADTKIRLRKPALCENHWKCCCCYMLLLLLCIPVPLS